ncbi:MAG: efflux RND transporter periplasmic adaptor subunit [Desulfatiglandaceae bacterium]|jgi:RND family efflux transporter MFP subunit
MQQKPNVNHLRLKSPEAPFGGRDWSAKTGPLAVCLALLLGLLLTAVFPPSGFAGPPRPGAGPPPLVTVAPVTLQDVNPPMEYVGHVEAVQAVDLRARVEGFLEQINFREGTFVQTGDLLYVIEQGLYQAKVDADRAGIAQAQATLTKTRQYLERVKTVRSGGISATDIDNAVADELRARAQLQEAQATLERSELDLGYTTIKAPISGQIGRTSFTRGNLVGPTSGPLARIVQLDPIRVVYSISENDLSAVQAALRDADQRRRNALLVPRIRLADGKVYKSAGKIDFVNNEVDATTGTISVRAVFDNPDGLLLPGQYVTVLVSKSKPKILPVVPQSAVQEDREGPYVLVVDNQNRVVQRRVRTGPFVGSGWAVESGLAKGEMIIVQGVQKVHPGQTVKTTTPAQEQGR